MTVRGHLGRVSRASRLVQRGGEPAAGVARQRVVDAELVEHADDDAAQVVLGAVGGREGGEERVEGGLGVAAVQGGERLGEVGVRRPARAAGGRPGPRPRSRGGLEELGASSRSSCRSSRMRASARRASVRAGSSSSARRREASSPAATSRSASLGTRASKNALDGAGGWAPTNSATTRPSLNALTAGMPWMPKARGRCAGWRPCRAWPARPRPHARPRACSSTGPERRHGPHHSAQKSTTTGMSASARGPPARRSAR